MAAPQERLAAAQATLENTVQATLDNLPAELMIMIMKNLDDFSTLGNLVMVSPDKARNVYRLNARAIFAAILANMPPGIVKRDLVNKVAFVLIEKSLVTSELGPDRSYWSVGSNDDFDDNFDVWRTSRLQKEPLETLRVISDAASEVLGLAGWVENHQDDPEIANRTIGSEKLSHAVILTALWNLKYYTALAQAVDRDLDVIPPPQNWHDHYKLTILYEIRSSFVESIPKQHLRTVGDILSILYAGYNQLLRHRLRPESDSLLDLLFSNRKVKSWTRDLKSYLEARWRAVSPSEVSPGLSRTDLMEEVSLMLEKTCLEKPSRDGVLKESDRQLYNRECRPTQDYLEQFRPLLGLPQASSILVADLVGATKRHGKRTGGLLPLPLDSDLDWLSRRNWRKGRGKREDQSNAAVEVSKESHVGRPKQEGKEQSNARVEVPKGDEAGRQDEQGSREKDRRRRKR